PGADSKLHFFSMHDYLNTNDVASVLAAQNRGFMDRLRMASGRANSYDRYTVYRMLAQMGTDSVAEEDDGKINLNYVNVGGIKATELISWTNEVAVSAPTARTGPELFFLSVVTNLLSHVFPGFVNPDTNSLASCALQIPILTNSSR